MSQITTITFFRLKGAGNQFWALGMMQFAHGQLKKVKGQRFYKLMGSGRGAGFNPWPDWSVYSLLQVWESEDDAMAFFTRSAVMEGYRAKVCELWSLFMRPIKAYGAWSGGNPFDVGIDHSTATGPIAVITRATIKWNKLIRFWSYVPRSQRPLSHAEGLIYTKGIGEWPLLQMATFSLWENEEGLHKFAYDSSEHRGAIRRTRSLNWYGEELFARFRPYRSVGTWGGGNLISPFPEVEQKSGFMEG